MLVNKRVLSALKSALQIGMVAEHAEAIPLIQSIQPVHDIEEETWEYDSLADSVSITNNGVFLFPDCVVPVGIIWEPLLLSVKVQSGTWLANMMLLRLANADQVTLATWSASTSQGLTMPKIRMHEGDYFGIGVSGWSVTGNGIVTCFFKWRRAES